MRRKLDWIEVLNEQTNWYSRADLQGWLNRWVGRPTTLLDGTVECFEECLGFMRRQVAYLHFNEPVDLLWLDTQLKTISLGLLHHQGAQEGSDSQLPRFHARVKGMIDSDLLRAVKDSLLVQFAEFVGDSLDGTASHSVSRCEGLLKKVNGRIIPAMACYTADLEKRWYDEISLMVQCQTNGSDTSSDLPSDLERCVHLVAGAPKTQFCSDTCRFATFQIAKHIQQPTYLPDKQRQYRRRQRK